MEIGGGLQIGTAVWGQDFHLFQPDERGKIVAVMEKVIFQPARIRRVQHFLTVQALKIGIDDHVVGIGKVQDGDFLPVIDYGFKGRGTGYSQQGMRNPQKIQRHKADDADQQNDPGLSFSRLYTGLDSEGPQYGPYKHGEEKEHAAVTDNKRSKDKVIEHIGHVTRLGRNTEGYGFAYPMNHGPQGHDGKEHGGDDPQPHVLEIGLQGQGRQDQDRYAHVGRVQNGIVEKTVPDSLDERSENDVIHIRQKKGQQIDAFAAHIGKTRPDGHARSPQEQEDVRGQEREEQKEGYEIAFHLLPADFSFHRLEDQKQNGEQQQHIQKIQVTEGQDNGSRRKRECVLECGSLRGFHQKEDIDRYHTNGCQDNEMALCLGDQDGRGTKNTPHD